MENVYWPRQLAIARANHMTLRQYEGGVNSGEGLLLGNPKLLVYGGDEQFGDTSSILGIVRKQRRPIPKITQRSGVSAENIQRSSSRMAARATPEPGPGVRDWPLQANQNSSDAGNPVWTVTLAANKQRHIK